MRIGLEKMLLPFINGVQCNYYSHFSLKAIMRNEIEMYFFFLVYGGGNSSKCLFPSIENFILIPSPGGIPFSFVVYELLRGVKSIPRTRHEAHDLGLTNQSPQTDTEETHDFTKPIRGILRPSLGTTRKSFSSFSKHWSWPEPLHHLTTREELAWEWRQSQRESSNREKLMVALISCLKPQLMPDLKLDFSEEFPSWFSGNESD